MSTPESSRPTPEATTQGATEARPTTVAEKPTARPEVRRPVAAGRAAPVEEAAPTGEPVFQLSGADMYYGDFRAVRDVNLEIREREITAFIGPSGCGKTTLLKIVGGLVRQTSGEVRIDGRLIDGPGPDRAVVFQDFALLPWANVIDNVAVGLEVRDMGKAERQEVRP